VAQGDVEIVSRLLALWDAADFDGMVELLDPDVVASAPEGWPESGPWHGRVGMLAQMRTVRANFRDQTINIEQVETRRDWVVTRYRVLARGLHSGLDAEFEIAGAFRLRVGKVAEARFFWRHGEALQAVGRGE
jgi:ketosteroid isomerase-like protein